MSRNLLRFRFLAGWSLLAAVLAGAIAPHSHPLSNVGEEGGGAAAYSQRVITDDGSNNLRWHSVLRVEDTDCVACHSQRSGHLARALDVASSSERPETLATPAVRACPSPSRPRLSSRAPPSLL